MEPSELAKMLDGGEYRAEMEPYQLKAAKENGLVVIFGASDDLMKIRGASYDELDCYEGGTALFTPAGLLANPCRNDECPYFAEETKKAVPVKALWCKEEGYSWTYETEIPHTTFEIKEDGEPYCRGIVFYLKDAVKK